MPIKLESFVCQTHLCLVIDVSNTLWPEQSSKLWDNDTIHHIVIIRGNKHTHTQLIKVTLLCVYWRLLELGLEGKVIRSQDLSHVILMVAKNPQGSHLAWNFVKKNWDALVQKFVYHFTEALLMMLRHKAQCFEIICRLSVRQVSLGIRLY